MTTLVIKMPKGTHWVGLETAARYFEYQYPRHPINDANNGTNDNIHRHSIFVANTEADGIELAKKVAQENPGYEIYVANAAFIMQSATPDVIEKRITEQGTLPT